MAYSIDDKCIGCTICAQKCPVGAIEGSIKGMHVVDTGLCTDCGVCGSFCPVDCIYDELGRQTFKIQQGRPNAIVDSLYCSGCTRCVTVCPSGCLEMVEDPSLDDSHKGIARNARPKDCVGCRLCEVMCGSKRAIKVHWPDGDRCVHLQEKHQKAELEVSA